MSSFTSVQFSHPMGNKISKLELAILATAKINNYDDDVTAEDLAEDPDAIGRDEKVFWSSGKSKALCPPEVRQELPKAIRPLARPLEVRLTWAVQGSMSTGGGFILVWTVGASSSFGQCT